MTQGHYGHGMGPTSMEAGTPMKQKTIGFRDLLERVLPVEELLPADRMHVQRALRSGMAAEVERAALQALQLLERSGSLRRVPQEGSANSGAVRYQARNAHDVITVHLPGIRVRDGLQIQPRSVLPSQGNTRLEQVRRLLKLDDPMLFSDPRSGPSRDGLMARLDLAGRELFGASATRFYALPGGDDAANVELDAPLDRALVTDVCAQAGAMLYCPDVLKSTRFTPAARERQVRSFAATSVLGSDQLPLGYLEVRSAEVDAFQPEDLALITLLADFCGGVLERASRIEKLVFIDPLTTAYNRSYFDLQVANEMARAQREQAAMALLIVDIDDFKSFNTQFGYEAGNQVLVQVAMELKRGVRPFDTVARWGGEEFAVLLTAPVLEDDVMAISERLRTTIERTSIRLDGLDGRSHRVNVTVSIGAALMSEDIEGPNELWRASNQALLKAKRPPKNQVVFHRPPAADQRFGTR